MSLGERSAEVARAQGFATRSALPWINLEQERIDAEAVSCIPLAALQEAIALPYSLEDRTLKVAIADPGTRETIEEAWLDQVEFAVASRASIVNALEFVRYSQRHTGLHGLAHVAAHEWADGDLELRLIHAAIEAGATDVHFVPRDSGILVRARIGGQLRTVGEIPPANAPAAISRLKVNAKLEVSEHRRSQEGRMIVATEGGRVCDIRLTTLPTVIGEGAALRLLERTFAPPTLGEIGLSDEMQLALEHVLNRRRGALLVSGPTGSGKSTTLYAALRDIDTSDLNVVTIEDPVEYRHDGAYQLEVNAAAGVTFPSALRAVLRGDPDIVALGELRDTETAATVLKAALTGCFVLSTIHARDAAGTITRLLEMDVQSYVVAATVAAVVAQRLARRLCIHCRIPYTAGSEAAEFGLPPETVLFEAHGCSACDKGYLGLVGIHQLLVVTDDIQRLILARAPYEDVFAAARAEGMRTLWEDGLAKAVDGVTTIHALRRAIGDV